MTTASRPPRRRSRLPREQARVDPIPYLPFDRSSPVPFYRQIYDGYRAAILSGRFTSGQRLPSTRALAEELQISRIPVLHAVEQLIDEGYLEGRAGSGTYVAESIPDDQAVPIRWLLRPPTPGTILESGGDEGHPQEGVGPFRVSLPALDRFPRETIAHLTRRHAIQMPVDLMVYGDPAGYRPLRQAIAEYLRTTRAVDCDADQVIIVSGSTMGIRIAAMGLTDSDSLVCVEEPGYPEAQDALRATNATIAPIAVDDEGIHVASIRRLGEPVKMVYVTPSHQYPLGTSMSVPRRIDLTDWAIRNKAWILEDDYDHEFRYRGRHLSSLQGMSAGGRVIYVGSFSKVLYPALRIGYVVVPRDLIDVFSRIRSSLDIFPPILTQLMLADFLREGHLARHMRRMRSVYRSRRDSLVTAIAETAADVLTIGNTDAGLHLVAFLPDGVDDQEVVRRASAHGMFPTALSSCYVSSTGRSGLLLGFAGSDEAHIALAVRDLADLIRNMLRPKPLATAERVAVEST
jgi:GntR family transcriptional regulator / MocR family aminotransferase